MTTAHPPCDHVWVVNRTEEFDGIYVFVDEDQARDFASRYPDAVVGEEVVMNQSAGAQFLIDTANDDVEPYDHSRDKEDRRNAYLLSQSGPAISDAESDRAALDAIVHILRDPEWSAGMLEDIAAIVTDTGRDITGDGTPTWHRH